MIERCYFSERYKWLQYVQAVVILKEVLIKFEVQLQNDQIESWLPWWVGSIRFLKAI